MAPKRKSLGSERKAGGGYIQVKVAEPDTWRLKQRVVWEAAHGPIPQGQTVCFLDGDKTNFNLENLVLKPSGSSAPLGTERVRVKGCPVEVKVGHPARWKYKHLVIWEEAHGPVPAGHTVIFIDGDKNNFALSNLRAEKKVLTRPSSRRFTSTISPSRQRPVGSEVLENGYIRIKVSSNPSVWRMKHRVVWEEAHGPVPQGFRLRFIDGDSTNCSLDNLALTTAGEMAERLKEMNHKAIGTEVEERGYTKVKVSRDLWRLKHHLVWEKAHGPIPDGMHVHFIDGDTSNCALENLTLVSNSDRWSLNIAPGHVRPIGAEWVNSKNQIMVKVAEPNVWRPKHRLVWEEANGPVPEGHMICFADKNPQNCDLSNLLLVSREESGYLTSQRMRYDHPKLNKAAAGHARLHIAINNRLANKGKDG